MDPTEHLRETLQNMEAQLAGFYEEQFLAGGRTHGELMQTLDNLEAQLKDIYDEREVMGAESAPIVAEIDSSDLGLSVSSLEAQVHVLLDEKNEHQATAEEKSTSVDSLEAQVRSLLDEKTDASEAIGSLEAQVAALLDEKRDLEAQLSTIKERARTVTHALIEQFVINP
jgi:chromosome segregation ATPase